MWQELRVSRPEAASFSLTLVDRGHHVWIQPVGAQGRVEAFLAVGKPDQPTQVDRIVAAHALSLFAIELAKSRAVADAERRLQGDFLDELAKGEMSDAEAGRGLARFGFAREAPVMVIALESATGPFDPDLVAQAATDLLAREDGGFLVSAHPEVVHLLVPADPVPDLEALAKQIGQKADLELRAGAGSAADVQDVAPIAPRGAVRAPGVQARGLGARGFADLGTYRLLLSMAEPDALRAFADALLAPLDAYDREQHGDLIASLQAFLQHNARWETAAAELFVHRHTLRYRMRKVEELTGRDLTSSFDRMEFWLALRARDLLAAPPDA